MTELEEKFEYHPPDEKKARQHNRVRGHLLSVAVLFDHILPEGQEKEMAMLRLQEAMFWANASIARDI